MSNRVLEDLLGRADPIRHRVLIALKAPVAGRGFFRGRSLLPSRRFVSEKTRLLRAIPQVREIQHRRIRLANGTDLPEFAASVTSASALATLRKSPFVDFVEPLDPRIDVSDFPLSCGADTYQASSDPRAQDERLAGPYPGSDLVPYAYKHHHIREAWARLARYGGAGNGQGIASLDTGISGNQQQFFSRYAMFFSRRSLLRLNETAQSIDDVCSHGTKVASIAAAPRDGRSIVGIAWRAPLTAIKVDGTPHATHADVGAICKGIADSVRPPDGRPPARVVAMAFGLTYFSPTIAECIESAFEESPRTVFVAAAGSGVTEVLFPANLDGFVEAVSMVEISRNGDGYRLMGRPLTVAYGPSVDFVSVIAPSKIPASGLTGNDSVDEIVTFGQSSAATGMYAGIIDLASQYAQTRHWSRAQLLSALQLSASTTGVTDFSGEPVEAIIGAGIVDAYRATGGARRAVIDAPYQAKPGSVIPLQGHTDAVVPPGASPPRYFRYQWQANGQSVSTGPTTQIKAPASGTLTVTLTVLDTVDHRLLHASQQIAIVADVAPPTHRRLYWASYVADWATFFNGGRHDRLVNDGSVMPRGCVVEGVSGLLMADVNGVIQPAPGETPQVSVDKGNVGFTVSRPEGLDANDLKVVVHDWHDGFSIVRTKVVYDIQQPAGVDCAVPGVLTTSP